MRKVVSLCETLLLLAALLMSTGGLHQGEVTAAGRTPAVGHDTYAAREGADGESKIAFEVSEALSEIEEGEMLGVIVTLSVQAELDRISARSRAERSRFVLHALRSAAEESQRPVMAWLAAETARGRAESVVPFWIFNGLAVTATKGVILELAARPDVARITPDSPVYAISEPAVAEVVESNLTVIGAPLLWRMGFRGQGVVVATLDTGVDGEHPELSAQWRGGEYGWYDPNGEHAEPYDARGHGTRVMGVILGRGASGRLIGIAPEARWISVKVFDDDGNASVARIHQAFEWLLDPDGNPDTADAPHVVSNSWAFGVVGCNLDFQPDLRVLRAMGILPIFAAGNYGPEENSSASPANNPEAFAVGSISVNSVIYAYSSRGPSACGEGMTVFPEIVAPGVDVYTADLHGQYCTATGTSLAAPHVAGALALLLSAYPDLPLAEQEAALLQGAADLGSLGPDNEFGYGCLDVQASYDWLAARHGRSPSEMRPRAYVPILGHGE